MIYFQNLKTGRVIGLKYLDNAISLTEHWNELEQDWDVYFA